MAPKQVVEKWVKAFNNTNVSSLQNLYVVDAVNHQMPNETVHGKEGIGNMFRDEFKAAPDMHCIPEQIISEGDWAVLE